MPHRGKINMADEAVQDINKENTFRSVYEDTTYFIDNIIQEYSVFPTILDKMVNGDATIELRKSFYLRAIDETWVRMIEDTLPSLDVIIRNPSRYIEDKEEILPVELTRKVTVRTLQHLAQHTDYISRIDGDEIIPKKLLNVFKEETLMTYENKFVNTLISRLYAFVNRRYEIAKKSGQDEKTTKLEFKENFDHDDVKVRMTFKLEIGESTENKEDEKVEENYSYTTDLWRRVERLNKIITTYAESEFAHSMGRNFIRPPVMRTNALMKNRDLHQCYLLWQFIESYEGAGYSMIVQENLEDIEESYIKELYSTLAIQYMIFRHNIKNEFEIDHTLKGGDISDELRPRIIDELNPVTAQEFDVKFTNAARPLAERTRKSRTERRYQTLTPGDLLAVESIDVALAADAIKNGREPEQATPIDVAALDFSSDAEFEEEEPVAILPEEAEPEASDEAEGEAEGETEATETAETEAPEAETEEAAEAETEAADEPQEAADEQSDDPQAEAEEQPEAETEAETAVTDETETETVTDETEAEAETATEVETEAEAGDVSEEPEAADEMPEDGGEGEADGVRAGEQ